MSSHISVYNGKRTHEREAGVEDDVVPECLGQLDRVFIYIIYVMYTHISMQIHMNICIHICKYLYIYFYIYWQAHARERGRRRR